jgi:S1-C subfamily serine protease
LETANEGEICGDRPGGRGSLDEPAPLGIMSRMRAQLLHLSGPLRGWTITHPEDHLLVGTDPDAQIRFDRTTPVRPRHAEIAFLKDDCAFLLRRIDGPVFVNHREVEEVFLQPGDLIEFGQDGPKARFRVYVENGNVCKPVRQMLGDASEVAKESGVLAFTKSFTRDLFTHATWQLKVGFPVAVLLVLASLSYLGGWFGARHPIQQQADAYARQLHAVREELDRVEADSHRVSRADVDSLRVEFAQKAAALDRMLASDAALKRILDVYRKGVCLIHGAYAFEQSTSGSPLRFRSSDGSEVEINYVGSGFLATGKGHVITNRHVVEPWLNDEQADLLRQLGFHPVFTHLTATFPGQLPVDVDPRSAVVRQDDVDVALLVVHVSDVPVLPLFDGDLQSLQGARAILIGYPAGVNALLAKADSALAASLTSADATLTSIIDGLAQHHAITPLITEGVLSEVLDKKLVYDAETTHGGSGGPVFGADGMVIGVNFAILRGFSGSNFGVPIRFARELLP